MENNELNNSKEHLNQEENEVVVLVEAFIKRIKHIDANLDGLEAFISALDCKEGFCDMEFFERMKGTLNYYIEELKFAVRFAENEATDFLAGVPCPSITINDKPRPVIFRNGKLRFVGSEKEAKKNE